MATPTALYVLVSDLISLATGMLCKLFELDFLTAGFLNERRRYHAILANLLIRIFSSFCNSLSDKIGVDRAILAVKLSVVLYIYFLNPSLLDYKAFFPLLSLSSLILVWVTLTLTLSVSQQRQNLKRIKPVTISGNKVGLEFRLFVSSPVVTVTHIDKLTHIVLLVVLLCAREIIYLFSSFEKQQQLNVGFFSDHRQDLSIRPLSVFSAAVVGKKREKKMLNFFPFWRSLPLILVSHVSSSLWRISVITGFVSGVDICCCWRLPIGCRLGPIRSKHEQVMARTLRRNTDYICFVLFSFGQSGD